MRNARVIACALVWALLASISNASPIHLYVSSAVGSTENTGCSAEFILSFLDAGDEQHMVVEARNTTPASIGSRLVAFGFELPDSPPFDLAFAPDGTSIYFRMLTADYVVSPGWLNPADGFDLMVTRTGSFEGGGNPNAAPGPGESQTVIISLGDTGKSAPELETLFSTYYGAQTSPFVIARFRAVGPDGEDSDKVVGSPDPASLCLLGFGALGLLSRRPSRRTWRR